MAGALVLVLCLAALAAPADAQVYTGRIDVTVSDATGGVLPGVTVVVSGPQSVTAVTDDKGEAHFLNLVPGSYAVTARIDDSAGLSSSMTVTVLVADRSSPPVNASPMLSITAPVDGATYTQGDRIAFRATADDPEDGSLSAALRWSSSIAGGRGRVRKALYAAAFPAAQKWNPQLVALYSRLKAQGKEHKKVLVACARKLLVMVNAIVTRGTPWIKSHQPA